MAQMQNVGDRWVVQHEHDEEPTLVCQRKNKDLPMRPDPTCVQLGSGIPYDQRIAAARLVAAELNADGLMHVHLGKRLIAAFDPEYADIFLAMLPDILSAVDRSRIAVRRRGEGGGEQEKANPWRPDWSKLGEVAAMTVSADGKVRLWNCIPVPRGKDAGPTCGQWSVPDKAPSDAMSFPCPVEMRRTIGLRMPESVLQEVDPFKDSSWKRRIWINPRYAQAQPA